MALMHVMGGELMLVVAVPVVVSGGGGDRPGHVAKGGTAGFLACILLQRRILLVPQHCPDLVCSSDAAILAGLVDRGVVTSCCSATT